MAHDQISRLKADPHYKALNQSLSREVEDWEEIKLPRISLGDTDSRFTWIDFAPRNILISVTGPPELTGLLDF